MYKLHKKELREGLKELAGENYDNVVDMNEKVATNSTNDSDSSGQRPIQTANPLVPS